MNYFVINWLSPAYVRICAVTTGECTKKGVFLPRRYFTIFAHRDILNSLTFNLSPIAGIQTSLAHPRIFGEKYAPCRERPSSEEVFPGGLRAAPHGSCNLSLQWLPVLHRRWRGDETPSTGEQAPWMGALKKTDPWKRSGSALKRYAGHPFWPGTIFTVI